MRSAAAAKAQRGGHGGAGWPHARAWADPVSGLSVCVMKNVFEPDLQEAVRGAQQGGDDPKERGRRRGVANAVWWAARALSRVRRPLGRFRVLWDVLLLISVGYATLMMPLQVGDVQLRLQTILMTVMTILFVKNALQLLVILCLVMI